MLTQVERCFVWDFLRPLKSSNGVYHLSDVFPYNHNKAFPNKEGWINYEEYQMVSAFRNFSFTYFPNLNQGSMSRYLGTFRQPQQELMQNQFNLKSFTRLGRTLTKQVRVYMGSQKQCSWENFKVIFLGLKSSFWAEKIHKSCLWRL